MAKLQVVVGGQYGSEGKGAVTAFLAAQHTNLLAVRVAGPNAGHTVIGRCPPSCADRLHPDGQPAFLDRDPDDLHHENNHPWKLQHVPVAAVTNPNANLLLAAGSEIDPGHLLKEMHQLESAGYRVRNRLKVDPQATIIDHTHQNAEQHHHQLTSRIGSTGKGVGAARAARALRTATLAKDEPVFSDDPDWFARPGVAQATYALGGNVLIEGTQGYGLGTRAGAYPYVTSSDCRAIDFLSMAGISPWSAYDLGSQLEVWLVYRAYPIRVSGNSGPMENETTWDALDLPTERTTVTNRVRRVGAWDAELARAAYAANGGPSPALRVAITMADHAFPSVRNHSSSSNFPDGLWSWLRTRAAEIGQFPHLVGTSPRTLVPVTERMVLADGTV